MLGTSRTDSTETIFWSTPRLKRLALAYAIGLFLALSAVAVSPEIREGVAHSDVPAFYTGALLSLGERSEYLYDQETQRAVQNEHFSYLGGKYLSFAYPPYVAVALRPLIYVAPSTSVLLLPCLSVLCVFSACLLLRKQFSTYVTHSALLCLAALAYAPIVSSAVAGQNANLSLLLLVALAAAIGRDSARGDFLGGLLLACWSFKPHFAFGVLLFLLVMGRFRVLLGFVPLVIVLYAIGAISQGALWWESYLRAVGEFSHQDYRFNAYQMVSLSTVSSVLLGRETPFPLVYGASFYCAAVVVFALLLRRNWGNESATISNGIYLLAPLLTLSAPHVLYYDAAIAFPALVSLLAARSDVRRTLFLLCCVLSFVFLVGKSHFAISPFLGLIVMSIWSGSCFLIEKRGN